MSNHAVFTYGTLMYQSIWEKVTGRKNNEGKKAFLSGYTRKTIIHECFPAITKAAESTGKNETITGIVYLDVDPNTLAKLDAYEGNLYSRELVNVSLGYSTKSKN